MRITSLVLTIALIALLFCGCSSAAPASDFEYHKDANRIVIDKYIGSDKEVVIPEKINSLPIEVIAKEAFKNTNITSVTIPDSVLYINEKAFFECKNLEEVNFGNGITFIGESAFSNCTALKKIILPEKLEVLESNAFLGCTSATKIFVPKTLKNWGFSVFSDCTALTNLTLEDGLEAIVGYAFVGDKALKNVTVPASVKYIDSDVFRNCASLETITFLGDVPSMQGNDIGSTKGGSTKEITIYYDPQKEGWDTTELKHRYTLMPISE